MQRLSEFFHKLVTLLEKVKTGNEVGQFVVSLAILIFGFLALEALWRYVNRRVETKLDRKGFKNLLPYLSGFLPAIRLAAAVLLLRIAELPLVIPPKLLVLLHGLELFLLTVAGILLIFQLVRFLDFFVSILPSDVQKKISEAFLTNFKTILRITGILIAAIVFIYSQKNLFPEWMWKSAWWRYLSLALMYAVIYSGGNFLITFMDTMTVALKDSEEKTRLRLVLKACLWPVRLLLLAIAVYATQEILKLPGTVDRIVESVANILGTLVIVIFLYRLLDVVEYELTKFVTREDNEFDLNFVQMVRIVAKVLVVVFGFIYLLKAATGKPMTTLLAGLGIGGLAVALAAQDTLKNLFGSFMVMIDKPFVVGDWVRIEGENATVEDIGLRSTRIRTFGGHVITIPNEKMAAMSIENVQRRPFVRRWLNLTITYDTLPDKVEKAVSIIKDILKDRPELDPCHPARVHFNEFNDASLNIIVAYWFKQNDYWAFVEFNEIVNFQIMRAFEAEGIEFAFPTTTTYLAQDDRRPLTIAISGESKQPGSDDKE
ncbi:MAG: mechanosensitive ion channel family protein [Deltaproteobacteria bacterium]|nr:mechanosensitive ion channel family protein [Deltaproteobacteria bacterium]